MPTDCPCGGSLGLLHFNILLGSGMGTTNAEFSRCGEPQMYSFLITPVPTQLALWQFTEHWGDIFVELSLRHRHTAGIGTLLYAVAPAFYDGKFFRVWLELADCLHFATFLYIASFLCMCVIAWPSEMLRAICYMVHMPKSFIMGRKSLLILRTFMFWT